MPVNGQGKPIVPGSSLKGALRSLHETMFGGCMRVIDRDFVPGYRDTVQSRGKGWTLVQVEEVEAGRPVRLRKCSRVVWAKATEIQRELGVGDLRSGMTVDVDETRIEEQTDTRHLVQTAGVRTGDGWVMLITDARARNNANTYWCALGKLSEHSQKLSQDAWDRFLASVEGADDLRTAVGELDLDEQKKRMRVRHDYRHGAIDVGFRDLACRELQPGQVLWGRAQDGEVADLALAQVWRHSGEGSVAERLPGFAPCSDPEDLCVSCRLFGSADDRSGGADEPSDGAARQDGYRGHIRFTDAVVVDESPKLERVELAPMGAPRPGAGQFYLRNGDTTAANERKQVPTREWGSAHDGGTPRDYRPIRGRKHYWHADPTLQQTPRHLARDHQSAAMRSEVELLGSGSRLRTRIWFENLDEVALGTLLATLVPERILSDPDEGGQHKRLAWRLGGGKPLGLGSLRVVDMPQLAELHTASSRYGDADPPNLDVNTLIGGARSSVPESVVQTWPDLAAVLQPEHVDPRLVWYPPGDKWQAVGSKSFDDGFEFWKQTSGEFLADDDNQRSLVELPQPRDSWQYLPIKYKSDRTRRR